MRRGTVLKDFRIELKLALGFGLLLSLSLLLSLLGLHGQNGNAASLRLISQVGNLFDEIVFTREANFNYALSGDPRHLAEHRQHLQGMQAQLGELDAGIHAGRWPAQYLATTQRMRAELDAYLEAREQARTPVALLATNERLSALLGDANRLYYAEEGHAFALNRKIRYLLVGIPLFALAAGILVAFYTGRRITSRYHRMEEGESRLRAILDTAVDGIITIDSRGLIQSVNRSVERLFGWTADELVGQNVKVLMPEPDRSRHDGYLANYLDSGVPRIIGSGREVMARRKDGSLMPIRLAVGRVDLPHELLFVGFVTDITQRHALEASLRETAERAEQAAAAKSTLLANMSHEIRTPMNAIIGFTELLLRDELSATQRGHLNTVRQSARSLLGLLNDILDTARLEKGGLVLEAIDFSLKDLASQVAASLRLGAQAKGLALTVHYPEGMGEHFRGDPLRIQQVLTNLLGNAIKFTEHGSVSLAFSHAGGEVHVQVRDTGIGMTPAQVAAIFTPFTQADASISRRFGGTGLGTAIASQLVELMGGRIEVESEPGRGSVFHVRLPLPAGSKPVAAPADDGALALPPLNVLVADDVPQNLELARLLLERGGHRVTTARDGGDAVRKFMAEPFDLVLMDVHMPGTDGLQATRRIRQYERDLGRTPTPVIALTASVMAEDRRAAHSAGMTGFALKPLDEARLMAEIAQVLHVEPPPPPAAAATPRAGAEAALIDWPAGVSLWGSEARLARAMRAFLDEAGTRHPLPDEGQAAVDWEALRFSLHGIRGAAGNLALPAIAGLAGELERQLHDGERERAASGVARLRKLLAAAGRELHASGALAAAPPSAAVPPEEAELLARLRELQACMAHSELNPAALEAVCAGLERLGEGGHGDALRAAVDAFEFDQAGALLARLLAARGSGDSPQRNGGGT